MNFFTHRMLDGFEKSIQECVINVKILKEYLMANNYPLVVSLAEDATAVSRFWALTHKK